MCQFGTLPTTGLDIHTYTQSNSRDRKKRLRVE